MCLGNARYFGETETEKWMHEWNKCHYSPCIEDDIIANNLNNFNDGFNWGYEYENVSIKQIQAEAELKGYTEAKKEIIEEIEEMINKKRKVMKENYCLNIEQWWSAEIFTGQEIDDLLKKLEEEQKDEKEKS